MLGDLPRVTSKHINKIIEEYLLTNNRKSKNPIPSFNGKKGNSVIWGRLFFPDLHNLKGDVVGRLLFSGHPVTNNIVKMQDPSVIKDIDTPYDFEN